MRGFEYYQRMVQALANSYKVTLNWIWSDNWLEGVKVDKVMVKMSPTFWTDVIDTIKARGK